MKTDFKECTTHPNCESCRPADCEEHQKKISRYQCDDCGCFILPETDWSICQNCLNIRSIRRNDRIANTMLMIAFVIFIGGIAYWMSVGSLI